jgi:hypothetical protein
MKILIITTIIWTAIACHTPEQKESIIVPEIEQATLPADWKRINECGFEFYIPSNLKEEKIQPFDSCAKEYGSENNRLLLDVIEGTAQTDSNFTRSKEYSKENDFKFEKTVIDGQSAEITTFVGTGRKGLDYGAVLDIPQMNLTIWTYSKSREEREKAIKVFKSIQKSVS